MYIYFLHLCQVMLRVLQWDGLFSVSRMITLVSYIVSTACAIRCLRLLVVSIRPVLHGGADGALGLRRPRVVAAVAEGEQDLVPRALDQLLGGDLGARRDGLHVLHDLLAEGVEGQIVHIHAEGVLDLVADEEDAKNDVRGEDGGGNRDPPERRVELEGKQHHVEPGDLRDDDGVGDGERGV